VHPPGAPGGVEDVCCARPAGRLWVAAVANGTVRRVLQLMPSAEEPAAVGGPAAGGRAAPHRHEFGRLHRLGPGLVSIGSETVHTLSLNPVEVSHWAQVPSGIVDAVAEPAAGLRWPQHPHGIAYFECFHMSPTEPFII
jgi:hypothetical protein